MKRPRATRTFALGLLLILASPPVLPNPRPAEPAPQDPDGKPSTADKNLSERQKKILDLFSATRKSFKEGRLVLEYDFETQNQDLPDDWQPALNPSNMRIRWARGLEGTYSTVEHGIVVGDYGEWIHKAVFLPEVEVEVDQLAVSQYKAGNIFAPVFYSDKKKLSLGANAGFQVVCLKGWKLAKQPLQKEERSTQANSRYPIGYKFKRGVFETYLRGKKQNDTSANPKYTAGFDSGHVGLAWSGSVQFFVFKVTIQGALDPAWIAKELKEPLPKSGSRGGKTQTQKAGKAVDAKKDEGAGDADKTSKTGKSTKTSKTDKPEDNGK